jgi:hypothetical protein
MATPGKNGKAKSAAAPTRPSAGPLVPDDRTAQWIEKARTREFHLWECRAALGQMLVRSPTTEETKDEPRVDTNLDLIMMGTEYVELPVHLKGIAFDQPTPEEAARLRNAVGATHKSVEVLMVVSGGQRYAIAASVFLVDENNMDVNESPFGLPWGQDSRDLAPFATRDFRGPFVRASLQGRPRA